MSTNKPKKPAQKEVPYSVYLPNEGLQGEDIPSNITWKSNLAVDSIKIDFSKPLKVKEVFNASNYEVREGEIQAKDIEVNGYLGLSFETEKIDKTEADIPVIYTIHTIGGTEFEVKKTVRLFKPKLRVKLPYGHISVEPKSHYVKGRLKIQNIGRGLLLLKIKAAPESQIKIETPREYKEFAEKFNQDLETEFIELSKEFPAFEPFRPI